MSKLVDIKVDDNIQQLETQSLNSIGMLNFSNSNDQYLSMQNNNVPMIPGRIYKNSLIS